MIALPILNISLTSFSSIKVGLWTCFSYSLLPPTKPQIPSQHPTPQPLAPQNPTSHFTNQKVQKRRFVGIPVGLTPPVMVIRPHRAAPSPPSSVTGAFFCPSVKPRASPPPPSPRGRKAPRGRAAHSLKNTPIARRANPSFSASLPLFLMIFCHLDVSFPRQPQQGESGCIRSPLGT